MVERCLMGFLDCQTTNRPFVMICLPSRVVIVGKTMQTRILDLAYKLGPFWRQGAPGPFATRGTRGRSD